MRRGHLVLLAALALPSASFASFELGLVLTATEVYRYDVETAAYLGKFGTGRITGARKLAINQSDGTAHVLSYSSTSGSRISVFNYNTGSLLRSVNFAAPSNYTNISFDNSGNYILSGSFGGSNEIGRWTSNGAFIGAFAAPSGTLQTFYDGVQAPNGDFYGLVQNTTTSLGNRLYRWNSSGLSPVLVDTLTTASGSPFFNLDLLGNKMIAQDEFSRPSRVYTAGGVGSTSISAPWTFPFSTSGTIGGAWTHTGYMNLWDTSASANHDLIFWDEASRSFYPSVSLGNSPTATALDFDIVVAPEPGTMLALAGGLGLFLRKRRR